MNESAKRFYNIGAGRFSHPDWINVDMPSEHYSSVQQPDMITHDLTTLAPLPIADASADIVYCSHVIEHVDDKAVAVLLSEAYRILKPGGTLRLVTPDIELAWHAWRRGDFQFFGPETIHTGTGFPPVFASCTQLFLHHFASQLTEIDADTTAARKLSDAEVQQTFADYGMTGALRRICALAKFNHQRPENHINWFDAGKLMTMVRDAGFESVYRSGVGQSHRPEMRDARIFDQHFAISLYVEAQR